MYGPVNIEIDSAFVGHFLLENSLEILFFENPYGSEGGMKYFLMILKNIENNEIKLDSILSSLQSASEIYSDFRSSTNKLT